MNAVLALVLLPFAARKADRSAAAGGSSSVVDAESGSAEEKEERPNAFAVLLQRAADKKCKGNGKSTESVNSTPWTCSACTYAENTTLFKCAMCGKVAPSTM